MSPGDFQYDQDDWGELELLPSESLDVRPERTHEIVGLGGPRTAAGFWVDADSVTDGATVASRRISVAALDAAIAGRRADAGRMLVGGTVVTNTWAYGERSGVGGLYGDVHDGVVASINVARCDLADDGIVADFAQLLAAIGARWNLVAVDWTRGVVVGLGDVGAVRWWLRSDAVER